MRNEELNLVQDKCKLTKDKNPPHLKNHQIKRNLTNYFQAKHGNVSIVVSKRNMLNRQIFQLVVSNVVVVKE